MPKNGYFHIKLIDKICDIFVSPSSVRLRKEDLSRSTSARLRTGVRWRQESTPFRQDTTNHPQFSCTGSPQYMQRRDWPEPQQSEWVICCLCPDVSEFLSAFSYLLVRMVSNPIHTPLGRREKKGRGGGGADDSKLRVSYQFGNLNMIGIAPIVKVVVKYCWHPRMCEYIGITLKNAVWSDGGIANETVWL